MVMCECLQISPSWPLWKSIFLVRPMACHGRVNPVRGVGFQVKAGCKYFTLKAVESAQGWRTKWFYVQLGQDIRPAFSTNVAEKTKAWEHSLSSVEEVEASPLLERVAGLMNTGVSGIQLIHTFLKARVCPLQQRVHPM